MFLDKSSMPNAPAAMVREQLDRHIGMRIRSAREDAGLSQADLAQVVQVSFQQIQKYEAAANAVNASLLLQIATALGVDLSFFFAEGRSDDMQH